MALITAVALFIVSLLTAVLSRVLAEEIEAWIPSIIRSLIKLAVAWLPENQRERFDEEWQSHVNEVPGRVGKLLSAAGFLLAAHRMALSFRGKQRVEGWLEMIAKREHSNSEFMKALNEIENDKGVENVSSAVSNVRSFLNQCNEHYGSLAALVSQLADLPTIPTTPTTLIAKLRIRYLTYVAQKGFATMLHRVEPLEKAFADLIKLVDERKQQRTLMASATKPMLNDVPEQ